jgi:murein DD-endopeptidase MepM/ murein hydrolase activator NlpD
MNVENILLYGIPILLFSFNTYVGYKKTGKIEVESILGILSYFMEKYQPKLEKQNHYNQLEPDNAVQKIEDKNEVLELESIVQIPTFQHPKPTFRVTSKFGNRTLTINGKKQQSYHNGTDFGGAGDCFAIEDCVIEKIVEPDYDYPSRFTWDRVKGWVSANVPKGRAWTPYVTVIGLHTKNRYTYRHVKQSPIGRLMKVGETYKAGEALCYADNLGFSMGAHLHIDIQEFDGYVYLGFINPEKFLESKGVELRY